MIRSLILGASLLVLGAPIAAQPASLSLGTPVPDHLSLPGFDNAALAARTDAARRAATVATPLRFAERVEVNVAAARRPGWETTSDGTRVWRLVVTSPSAYSLSFGFTRFHLPEGARLWIYADGEAPEYRPFTAADNEAHGQLWTPIVVGDRAVIELNLPATKPGDEPFELELGAVHHAFRPTLLSAAEKSALGAQQSGSCNVDVVCPEGDGYRDIIQSVGAYTVGGVDFCSGAAVNNTVEDGRPLFLTADHCGVTPGNAPAVVVYWNYQSPTCRAAGSAASGGTGDGLRREFNTGAAELADGEASDWSVLELDDPIRPESRVFYAGWDRRDVAPDRAVAIHHPAVEDKRISLENDPTTITLYSSDASSSTGTHIRVGDWDLGTTEGGSSGSPLFDGEKRIVGQLHGGGAACGNDAPDWYGRLHHSMNDGLAAILDPTNSGAETLDGRGVAFVQTEVSAYRLAPGDPSTLTFYVVNPTSADYAGATVTARIPPGLRFAGNLSSTAGAATVADDVVTWTGPVASGAELAVTFDVAAASEAGYGVYRVSATTQLPGGDTFDSEAAVVVITPRVAPTVTYEATPSLAIPDEDCPSGVTSTLSVAEGWPVGRVSAGVNVTHTWRSDLSIRLRSPSGTSVQLVQGQGDQVENIDVLFDDAGAPGALSGGTQSTAAPYYDTEVAPGGGLLAAFVGEPAQGEWALTVCDGVGQDTGTLNRWALYLVEQQAVSTEPQGREGSVGVAVVGPNPARARTRARVTLGRPQHARLSVLDVTGREVRRVFDGPVVSASADLDLDLVGLSSGTYLVLVQAEDGRHSVALSVVR